MNYLSTGDTAKALNISIRTLRYYDQIGLVTPAYKNDNGNRFYSDEDMLLLQKICLLKETSMSLKEIQQVIYNISVEQVLKIHLKKLQMELATVDTSLKRTHTLLHMLKVEEKLQWGHLLTLFDKTKQQHSEMRKMAMETLFNKDEQASLSTHLPKMEDPQSTILKWINILKRVELYMAEGKSPTSQAAQLLADDIYRLSMDTFAGDEQLIEKFWAVRKSKDSSDMLGLYPVKEEIINYIDACMVHYEEHQSIQG
ncbi:MerR family transcriptional regulator [Solibacillus sp. CAU 1738]|uniref:MerR family transcriptional regulator n=1 Tax=Solibacillus sp. CAU 1738 TaxID=3140363 RepID=UPI003261BF6D